MGGATGSTSVAISQGNCGCDCFLAILYTECQDLLLFCYGRKHHSFVLKTLFFMWLGDIHAKIIICGSMYDDMLKFGVGA